jgi:organic radical activating enzyme
MPNKYHFGELEVFLSPKCNYSCKHCAISLTGFTERELTLSNDDIRNICTFLSKYSLREIRLTGGEPTLNIETANSLISDILKIRPLIDIAITTNGWFCNTSNKCKSILNKFVKINSIQISYDKYHAQFTPLRNLMNLKKYCDKYNIDLNIACCISNPLDLVEMQRVEKATGIKSAFQNTLPINRALHSSNYYKYSYFDDIVLIKQCPNLDSLFYLPHFGFTSCCSSLLFSGTRTILNNICHKQIEGYLNSYFWNTMKNNSFGSLLRLAKLDSTTLGPQHSESCEICKLAMSRLLKELK